MSTSWSPPLRWVSPLPPCSCNRTACMVSCSSSRQVGIQIYYSRSYIECRLRSSGGIATRLGCRTYPKEPVLCGGGCGSRCQRMRRLLLRAWWHCGSADSREFVRGRLFFLLAQFVGLVRWRASDVRFFFEGCYAALRKAHRADRRTVHCSAFAVARAAEHTPPHAARTFFKEIGAFFFFPSISRMCPLCTTNSFLSQ